MKYKFCSIRINVPEYDVTFAKKRGSKLLNPLEVTLLHTATCKQ